MKIERVDTVGVPSRDTERSKQFYVETLGLRPDERSSNEFWIGETCFAIWEPERFGLEFQPQKTSIALLRVEDVAAARAELEEREWSSSARRSTPASATWPPSSIPTATS